MLSLRIPLPNKKFFRQKPKEFSVNSYLDRDLDAKMDRTKSRPLVTGSMTPFAAKIYAIILGGVLGFGLLLFFTNWLTVVVELIGYSDYILFYTLSKPKTSAATLIGSISGAIPLIAGYIAVTNHFDVTALLLFLVMAFWQMPHFYAIAMYRVKDYARVRIPVLPVQYGIKITKAHTAFFTFLFLTATTILSFDGHTGEIFLVGMFLSGAGWFLYLLQGFRTKNTTLWAKKMFFFSLGILLLFCVLLSISGTIASRF